MRVAVYYAPAPDDPLHAAGSAWLGRDAAFGPFIQPVLPDIAALTAEARRYGFHATLKPPMRLVDGAGLDDVLLAVQALAKSLAPFALPALAVADLFGFLALREQAPSPELQALADAAVAWLDPLRAPPTEAELARRRAARLSPAREANLQRWGYPDVFATWRFHMTLTRRLSAVERSFWQKAAEAHFAAALQVSREVRDICVFVEESSGSEFILANRLVLGSTPK